MLKTLSAAALFPLMAEMSADQLPDPANWMTMGWIVAGLFAIVGMANQGLELWRKLFPPQVPPAHEKFATKEELERALARIEREFDAEMGRIEEDTDDDFARVERTITDRLDRLEKMMSDDLRMEEGWQAKLDEWKLMMERAMGHVETKADHAIKTAEAALNKNRR